MSGHPLRQILVAVGLGVVVAVLAVGALVRFGAPQDPTSQSTTPGVVAPPDASVPADAGDADASDAARTLDAIDDAVTELERAVDTGAQEDGRDGAG